MNGLEVVVLCGGGGSSEREISLLSGENVYRLCKQRFSCTKVILESDELPMDFVENRDVVVFPLTHGEFGEDGRLQAAMETMGLIFVGSDSFSSSLCMDKAASKRIAQANSIPVAKGVTVCRNQHTSIDRIVKELGQKLFIKPNAKGSSIGASRISSRDELENAIRGLDQATDYVIEQSIEGTDLTVAVLDGKALEIIEIVTKTSFFDFENKYTPGRTEKICPARISKKISEQVKFYAEKIFHVCRCRDWARIDFMMQNDGQVFFLEINTIPGFTENSLFPISARAAGISSMDLATQLVKLAMHRQTTNRILTHQA